MYDLLIKDAEIHDGGGGAPVRGNLWVADGRVAGLGSEAPAASASVTRTMRFNSSCVILMRPHSAVPFVRMRRILKLIYVFSLSTLSSSVLT